MRGGGATTPALSCSSPGISSHPPQQVYPGWLTLEHDAIYRSLLRTSENSPSTHSVNKGNEKGRSPRARAPATTVFGNVSVLAILLDPVALLILLVLVLYRAPGYPVGTVLLVVLLLRRVESLL